MRRCAVSDYLTIPALPGLVDRGSIVDREGYGCFGVVFTIAARAGSVPHAAEVTWADTGAMVDEAAPDELRLVLAIDGEPVTASVDRLARWCAESMGISWPRSLELSKDADSILSVRFWSAGHFRSERLRPGLVSPHEPLADVLALRAVALELDGVTDGEE
jgi:hypothetical protein